MSCGDASGLRLSCLRLIPRGGKRYPSIDRVLFILNGHSTEDEAPVGTSVVLSMLERMPRRRPLGQEPGLQRKSSL